jgi:predicted alpha/beta hydrolase family esterase
MKRVILIHGNGGDTGNANWFPYIKHELAKLDVECLTPDMPDAVLARSKYWLPYIEKELKADENTILVGHSSGAVAALRYAQTHKLAGSVLVGAYYTDLGYDDEKLSGYFDEPWNWEAIKKNQEWIAIFASPTDPYISIEDPRHMRDQLNAEYYELANEGHFGGSGEHVKLKFPELLTFLKKRLNITQ